MMTVYDSYKDSGIQVIGLVPSHWKRSKFKYNHVEHDSRVGENWEDFPLLSLTKRGVILRDMNSGKGKFPESFDQYKKVDVGDLIFCLYDIEETPRTVGLSSFNGMITGSYKIFSSVDVLPRFTYYTFLCLDDVKGLKPYYTGMRNVVRPETFKSLPFHYPPLSEQQQIVPFLDTKTSLIDSMIEKTQRKIELLKDSIPNYHFHTNEKNQFVEMKEYWFQKKPSEWRILKLREIFDIISERNHPNERLLSVHQIKGVIYRDEQSQDVMNPSGDLSNYKLVKPGDFIISLRSSEGGFEYSEVTGLVSPVYTVLRPKFEIDTVFYKYLFKTHNFIVELNRFITGIRDGKNINFIDIRDVLVPVPLEFNYKVHQTHLNILKSFSLEEKRIELLKEYRQSLISEVVTGKRKVIV